MRGACPCIFAVWIPNKPILLDIKTPYAVQRERDWFRCGLKVRVACSRVAYWRMREPNGNWRFVPLKQRALKAMSDVGEACALVRSSGH